MPNYGLLAQALSNQNVQTPNLVGGFLSGLQHADEKRAREANLRMAEKQHELATLQGQRAQAELDYLPTQQKMEQERHAKNLAMQNLNMQATRQGMETSALQQQQIRQQMDFAQQENKLKQVKSVHDSLGHIWSLPEEERSAAYKSKIQQAKKEGLSVDDMPKEWNEEAKVLTKNMFFESGIAARQLEAQVKQQQLKNAQNPLLKKQTEQFDKMIVDASKSAINLTEIKDRVHGFLEAEKKIPMGTGPIAGLAGKYTAAGQEAVKHSNELALKILKDSFRGSTTDRELTTAQQTTLNIRNSPETNRHIGKLILSKADQYSQQPQFFQTLKSRGITDPAMADLLWSKYISENPLFDQKTKKLRETVPSWKKYTSPEYINKVISDSNEEAAPNSAPSPSASKTINGKNYININGQWYEQ